MNAKTLFFRLFLLILLPWQLSLELQASSIDHVYEVTLPVADQQRELRQKAFEQALVEVSVRVSGSSLTPMQLEINKASRLVRQYRYQVMEAAEIESYMKRTSTLIEPKYKLWIQFDDGKIKQLLRNNGLPIWGYQRPNVLVWLAVKDGKNRYVLKQSDQSLIKDAVEAEARRRGLPIVWPSYDATDKQRVSFIDLWGQFWEPLKEASQRYPVDAVIIGRMNWSKGSWQADWSLLLEDKTEYWQLSAVDLDLLMGSGIGVATDHISRRFAVFADSENDAELRVRIRDLKSVSRYAKATRYLASLAPVRNIYATDVREDYTDFHVDLSGNRDDLKRIIALGRVLVPDTTPMEADLVNPAVALPGGVAAAGNSGVTGTGASGTAADNSASGSTPAAPGQSNGVVTPGIAPGIVVPGAVPLVKPKPLVLRYRLNG